MSENDAVASGGQGLPDLAQVVAVAITVLATAVAVGAAVLREPIWAPHSTLTVASECPLPGASCAGHERTVRIDLGCGMAASGHVPSTSDGEGR